MKKIIIIAVLFFTILSSCNSENDSSTVIYNVTCDQPGLEIEYNAGTRTTKYADVSNTVWTFEYEGQLGETVSVSAKSKSENSKITIEIYYDGNLFAKESNIGDFPEVYINERL